VVCSRFWALAWTNHHHHRPTPTTPKTDMKTLKIQLFGLGVGGRTLVRGSCRPVVSQHLCAPTYIQTHRHTTHHTASTQMTLMPLTICRQRLFLVTRDRKEAARALLALLLVSHPSLVLPCFFSFFFPSGISNFAHEDSLFSHSLFCDVASVCIQTRKVIP
jgi:hypothetical protein